ncbi:SpaH/EbpB family LPXTG-anchored major pilin [Enterococcus ureasiticus]|uniref:Uncharacterized protein n=1 Tax=Enterococcus ureasiticus TaxID=903984 RepID=A0A1E5GEX5_9ENTE|nr:SpaH/EbpB family LPXTG-anchored major pilin [Enterococcus ureasiticus]OEG11276.1 hypothetical protein BCR21_08200 [Enterococcus ureasiticus]
MKQMNLKHIQFVVTLFLATLFLVGFGEQLFIKAEAADTRTVILHKKKFSQAQTPVQNTGKLMVALDSVEGLNGIEFKVYDISTEFYALVASGKTVEEAQAQVATTTVGTKTPVSTGTTATVDGKVGEVSFNLESVVGGKNAVYLIVETPKAGVDTAANLVVAFPVYEIVGTEAGSLTYGDVELTTVHLYPKNVVLRGKLEVEKKSTVAGKSVEGAKFVIHRNSNYGVAGTEYYKELKANGIVDWTTNAAQAKEFVITNSKFQAEGLEFGNYYFTETVAPTNHGIINSETVNRPFTIDAENRNVSFTDEKAVLNDGISIDKSTGKNTAGGYDFNIGEKILYTITIPVPLGIADKLSDGTNRYKEFKIKDTHDSQLSFENAEYEIKVDGSQYTGSAYTLTPGTNGFEVKLNDGFQELLKGKNEIVFTYFMTLNKNVTLQSAYKNNAVVTTDFETATATAEPVLTYGKRFIKVDADQNNKPLAGTVFVVRSADSDTASYLKQVAEGGLITKSEWTANTADRTEFVTDATGIVDILGLKSGDYWLEEVTAPAGYVKLSTRVKFTVNANSYYDGENILSTNVINKHKGTLPVTGGMGIYLIIGLGITAMMGSGVWYLKRKDLTPNK